MTFKHVNIAADTVNKCFPDKNTIMTLNSNLQINRKKKFYDILPVSLCLAGAGHGFNTGRARGTLLFSPRASSRFHSSFALKNPARAIRRLFPSLSSNKKFLFSLFE